MNAIVIGAGLGGLASAISLAAAGVDVEVFEAHSRAGGKAGVVVLDGVEVDTGPSILTMPDVLDSLLMLCGRSLSDVLTLRAPEPAFRYLYPDGVALDVFSSVDATVASVEQTLGAGARAELVAFLAYAGRIWESVAPHFVYGAAPTWSSTLSLGLPRLLQLTRIDPLRTMQKAIQRQVTSPHLRRLLTRYATYNGSDPRRAPATLNCIAHVELAMGGFGVEGGISAMVAALVEAAESVGVRFRYDAPVKRILLEGRRAAGVEVDGRCHRADVVVANADARLVAEQLLPPEAPHRLSVSGTGSMSGWTGIYRARRSARIPHTVLFCDDYDQEFADIFDLDRPPVEPTIYLCAQEACHGRAGWSAHEPLFAMVNAPPDPVSGRDPGTWSALETRVDHRLLNAGLLSPGDALLWRRSPTQLAAAFPGSQGSIYGAASNDMLAAFRRPANRIVGIPGLYLASGSAHPGGGMPLAMLSGRAAAAAIHADRSLR